MKKIRTVLTALVLSSIFSSPVFADIASKKFVFQASPMPKNAIARAREYARNRKANFKFPFEYKNAFFLWDKGQGVSKVGVCLTEGTEPGTLSVEVKGFGKAVIFGSNVDDFNALEYVSQLLPKVFPEDALKLNEVKEPKSNLICDEIEKIQWPENTF